MGARLLLPYPSPHSGVTSTSLTAIEIVALSRAALLMGARVFLPYPSPHSGVTSTSLTAIEIVALSRGY